MIGLSGSNLAIGISLVLRDRFTGPARSAAAAMDDLDAKARASALRQMEMQRNINATGAAMGLMAMRGMANMVKVGAKFGYMMEYVSTIAEKRGGIGLDQLSQRAKDLGVATMFTAQQVADGMKYMAMAGMNTQEIFNNINAAVTLAGATMERLEGKGGAADIMTNIMRGFNIEGTEANSMRVADVLTKAVTSANTNLWDLHEAMKYTISSAKDLNVTLEETAAAIMMAGDAGIQGSMAGTAAENMLRYVTRAADETRKGRAGAALQKLGLSPKDLQDTKGNLLAISPLLATIGRRIEGMGTVQKQNLLTDIFGVRGKREASILLRNMQHYDKYVNLLTNSSQGAATSSLNAQMATLEGTLKKLTSQWEYFQIAFTEAITPVLQPILLLVKGILWVVTKLTETPVGKFLATFAAGFVLVKTVSMGYRAIVLSLQILHARLGTGFAGTAGSVVNGYNAMTTAANRYAAASGRAGAVGGLGGIFGFGGKGPRTGLVGVNKAGRYYNKNTGRFVSVAAADRYNNLIQSRRGLMGTTGIAGKLNKWGGFMGRASMPAMIGGMALQMGSTAAGENTGLGKTLGVAGDTLGWAGTGAMIGSIIPGIGTAIGGIVGGIGGLLYGLYTRLDGADKAINAQKDTATENIPTEEQWRRKIEKIRGLKQGDSIWYKGWTPETPTATTREGANQWLWQGGNFADGRRDTPPSHIVINIDGMKAFDKQITERNFKTLIDLGVI